MTGVGIFFESPEKTCNGQELASSMSRLRRPAMDRIWPILRVP
jgi:hypothetical protein